MANAAAEYMVTKYRQSIDVPYVAVISVSPSSSDVSPVCGQTDSPRSTEVVENVSKSPSALKSSRSKVSNKVCSAECRNLRNIIFIIPLQIDQFCNACCFCWFACGYGTLMICCLPCLPCVYDAARNVQIFNISSQIFNNDNCMCLYLIMTHDQCSLYA